MNLTQPSPWTDTETALWQRLAAHPFETPGHSMDFTARLARDRGWSLAFARGAVHEYRRFCFLTRVSPTPMTPSEEVDEVWHTHLAYSRDYWDRWCPALGGPLHHDPTPGGPAAQGLYRTQYAETLALYERRFGPPPEAYWPATHRRFRGAPRYRIVDADRVFVLKRPALPRWRAAALVAIAGTTATPAGALPLNPLDWPGPPFLALFAALFALSLAATLLLRARGQDTGDPASADNLSAIDLAYMRGGAQNAADTIAVGLLMHGGAEPDGPASRRFVVMPDAKPLPPELEPFRTVIEGSFTRPDFLAATKQRFDALQDGLVRRGLLMSGPAQARLRERCLWAMTPLLLLGLAKVMTGLSRGRPVDFLVFFMLLAVVATILARKRPRLTRAGRQALRDYRRRHDRAVRAPLANEVMLAFALTGPAVLAGTAAGPYGAVIWQAGADGSYDGGSGSGSGGGGDGGGGGGCGGCS